MTTEEAIKAVQDAGFSWAIGGDATSASFSAAVSRSGYAGDTLSTGLGIGRGATMAEALMDAMQKQIEFEAYQARTYQASQRG